MVASPWFGPGADFGKVNKHQVGKKPLVHVLYANVVNQVGLLDCAIIAAIVGTSIQAAVMKSVSIDIVMVRYMHSVSGEIPWGCTRA